MNLDVTHGPWRRFKIQLRKTWSELTDDDLEAISRGREDLVHVVQHCYGTKRNEATKPPRAVDEISWQANVCLSLSVSASAYEMD